MSTEMAENCGACVSAVESPAEARGGAGTAPGGGAFSRSRSPISDLLAAEQTAQERAPWRLIATCAGDERRQALDVLREARPGRRVSEEQTTIDGVDDRDQV